MTSFILPPILGLAAIGVGFGLTAGHPVKDPGPLPALVLISHPIGTPASEAMVMAHPAMPAVEPARVVRVVLSSPFVPRASR
jgi:hypothetical protein